MTPADLRAHRLAIAPDMSMLKFARAMGYRDADAYRKYESGAREIPRLLALAVEAMAETNWRPDDWPEA